MSKTWVSVLIVVLVLVGGYFAFRGGRTEVTENETGGEQEGIVETSKKMAFSEFVKQDGSYKCDVKQAMSDFENEGTVYISEGNISGEFTTIAEGRPMQTMFMMRDGYSYTWSSALPNMGFKVKVNTTLGDGGTDTSGTYSWNANQIGDYNCEAWNADQSKFSIPTNVKFQEMNAVSAE